MSVRISVESLSGCAWNGCPSQRGIRRPAAWLHVAGLQQLNWDSEGVGSKAAALVDLSTVAGNKISNPPWVKFQSAGWVNFPSAPTFTRACNGLLS